MTTASTLEPSQIADAVRLLGATLERKRDVVALDKLNDHQLWMLLHKSFKTSRSTRKAALVAHNLAVTFRRVANLLSAKDSDASLAHVERAQEVLADLVASKVLITSGELTGALGHTRQALRKAVLAHRVFAVEVGGENYYPAFYADGELDRRKLEQVSKLLGELSGWSRWQFFTTPNASLEGLTPIQALKGGQYDRVATAAAAFAER